jgi:hypothetical protein
MRRFSRNTCIAIALLGTGAVGCEPTFKPKGTLLIQDADFGPIACHVLVNDFGVSLENASGARLELTLPPARLDAWQSVDGVIRARFAPSSGALALDLGACGALKLTGEGYHGQRKRAASGQASLSCSGGVPVKGNFTFSGCF